MRLLAVHAHPDDEASKGAATAARYVSEGHRVRVVTATGGERGDVLNPNLDADLAARLTGALNETTSSDAVDGTTTLMAEIRRQEMAAAAHALGIEHVWLGFVDSGLPEGDPLPPLPPGSFAALPLEDTVPALVAQLREFRPHVVTTYNEEGGYPHPDHIRTHEITMAALQAAADQAYRPDLGEPWEVLKVYFDISFSRERIEAFHQALRDAGLESPFEEWQIKRSLDERKSRVPTARVWAADWFEERDAALRAHATQVDPEGFFFQMPRHLEREVWPWEEFELAYSRVPVRDGLEESLFEGINREE